MRIQSLNHSTYQLQYHLVWGTKYRRKFLKPYVKEELLKLLNVLMAKYPTLHIVAVNTDEDHIHMQIEIAPNVAIATIVQRLKGYSSIYLRKKFKFIRRMYLEKGIWSVGYFVSSIGLDEGQIRTYIEEQGKKDVPQTLPLFENL